MSKRQRHILGGALLLAALALIGCCVNVGDWQRSNFQRTVELSTPFESDATVQAATGDGSIAVMGQETSTCQVSATIAAYAPSVERAQQLAEQTRVELVPAGQVLRVVSTLPARTGRESIDVSLRMTVPRRTSLDLHTGDGSVTAEDLTGSVKAHTGDGSITARRITGPVELQTSDGKIECVSIEGPTLIARTSDGAIELVSSNPQQADLQAGDGRIMCDQIAIPRLHCRTSDGAIEVHYTQQAPGVLDVNLSTSDGSIELICPPQVSAAVDAHVGDGSITTDLPVVVKGKLDKALVGTIGQGEGRIALRTNDGSIHLR